MSSSHADAWIASFMSILIVFLLLISLACKGVCNEDSDLRDVSQVTIEKSFQPPSCNTEDVRRVKLEDKIILHYVG